MSLLYQPPEGYYDLPFIFVYDGDALANGSDALNLFIPMEPDVGDFVLRRVVGIQSVVNPVGGKFQLRDNLEVFRYLQSLPIFANGTDDFAVLNEMLFESTGAIRFDLYNVLLAFSGP
jgi:hypothetical protein